MTYTQMAYRLLMKLPHSLFVPFSRLLLKSEANREWIAKERIKNYAVRLMKDFDGECERIAKRKRIMVIRKGNFSYSYFNIAFTNNVMNLILYAMYRGCIPDIQINADRADTMNNWEWYFVQPHQLYFGNVKKEECKKVECEDTDSIFGYWFDILWDSSSDKYKIFEFLYKKFLRFNTRTEEYLQKDHEGFEAEKALGVIARGTDYTHTKPKWHPIQPDIEEIVEKLREEWDTGRYTCIYVATEEKKLFDRIAGEFGREHVYTMQKTFYDDIYYSQKLSRIGDVKFDRKDDNYLKGIEYLSSLVALSKCRTIVGGNCGGTMLAAFLSADNCKHHIFNLGLY